MSRRIEQYELFEVILQGGIRVAPQQPIEILVSRVPVAISRRLLQEPFWAYTAKNVERICGPYGVKLRGGDMLPWDIFTHTGGLVVVRLFPCKDDPRHPRPIVDLNSLLKLGLR